MEPFVFPYESLARWHTQKSDISQARSEFFSAQLDGARSLSNGIATSVLLEEVSHDFFYQVFWLRSPITLQNWFFLDASPKHALLSSLRCVMLHASCRCQYVPNFLYKYEDTFLYVVLQQSLSTHI